MIKKWLYIFYISSIFVLLIYIILIFFYSKKEREYIFNRNLFVIENFLIKEKSEEIATVKRILENEYNTLLKNYKKHQVEKIKKEINSLEKILEIISIMDKKSFFVLVNNLFEKYNFNFEVNIVKKGIVVASNKFANIGKYVKLKCNPFKNYGSCELINDNHFYYVKYLPSLKEYLIVKSIIPSPKKDYFKSLIFTLKSIPDIIVPKIKGKMDSNHFYLFEEFKPLKIFFGVGISYKELENYPKEFVKEMDEFLFYNYLKLILLMSGIMVIYLTISTFLFFKIKDIGFQIEKETMFDRTTNLLNRKGIDKYFKKEKTLLLIDLDNFKYINDTFGHQKGDEVLVYISNLLKEYFKGDIIGRWGGDEFIVFTDKSQEKVKRIIFKINNDLKKFQETFDKKLDKILSVSCGGSNSHVNKDEKFKEADFALYEVKHTTKANCLFFCEIKCIKLEKE